MPSSAPSRCTRRCGRLATHAGRCDEHQRRAWENTSKRNQLIDKGRWKRVADKHLQHETTCRVCGTDADLQVDHITEVTDGGSLYDEFNLQTLCEAHHEEKTALHRRLRDSQHHS